MEEGGWKMEDRGWIGKDFAPPSSILDPRSSERVDRMSKTADFVTEREDGHAG
jgi:hypothetical protein